MDPGCHPDGMSTVAHPPAKVDFLHVGKEILVQPSDLPPGSRLDQQGGSGSPEHLAVAVILTPIELEGVEYPSCTEHESIPIHVSPCRSGVLEFCPPLDRPNLRLRRNPTVSVAGRQHAVHPSIGHFDIAIEQQSPLRITLGEEEVKSAIVASGETMVPVQLDHRDFRKFCIEQGKASIVRSIVDDHDDVLLRSVCYNGWQKPAKMCLSVPIQDGHRDPARRPGSFAHLNAG